METPLWQLAALLGLAAIGAHRLVLTLAYLSRRGMTAPGKAWDGEVWPFVTVQLPVFNERFVAERLLRAACRLDYPRDRFEVQVLDDSTDDTRALLARAVAGERARGVAVEHVTRDARDGYKAGALAHGARLARGELFAVLDADFEPPPDMLRRVVGAFADPRVGFVQLRWDHANRARSLLTRTEALLLDGHFLVEHHARFSLGHFFNFNGTAGVLRRRAIDEAGGWASDTLTEDLDLSYRMQIAGWRGVYLKDVTCPGDLPSAMADFKGQQRRWVEGSIQTARKLALPLWRCPLPLATRLEAALHLLTNLAYPLMLAGFAAAPFAVGAPSPGPLAATWLGFGTAGVLAFYAVAHADGAPVGEAGPARLAARASSVAAALALGAGLAVTNTFAVARGLVRSRAHFERTPKLAAASERPAGYRSWVGLMPLLELAVGLWLAYATALAIARGLPVLACFLALFASGTLWVAIASFET